MGFRVWGLGFLESCSLLVIHAVLHTTNHKPVLVVNLALRLGQSTVVRNCFVLFVFVYRACNIPLSSMEGLT